MFSVRQKREISEGVQKLLRDTGHPELPEGEITSLARKAPSFRAGMDSAGRWTRPIAV